MLFSRIYNWIKYKTLPPSLLFNNRLYVERDSKHRRVVSNFGLTFRNSKWSSYSRVNINLTSRPNYIKLLSYIFLAFTLISITWSWAKYYDFNLLNNPFYSLVWFLLDADIYVKVIFVSSWLCISQLLISNLHDKFVSSLVQPETNAQPLLVPKSFQKVLLYRYLTTNQDKILIEKLVTPSFNQSTSLNYTLLSKYLFTSSNLLSKSTANKTDLISSVNLLTNQTPLNTFKFTQLRGNLNALELDYLVFKLKDSSASQTSDEFYRWALEPIHTELNNSYSTLITSSGLFYNPSLTYSNLQFMTSSYPELSNLNNALFTQLAAVRQQRWLYKYNLLHRSTLSAANNITLAKKLINSGFLNSSLFTRNIWAASSLNNLTKNTNVNGFTDQTIKSLYTSTYGNYENPNFITVSGLTSVPTVFNGTLLTSLNNYETSYYWFLQRFYQYNTLSTASMSFNPQLKSESYSLTAKNMKLLANATTLFDSYSLTGESVYSQLNSVKVPSSTLNDHYLNYTDYSLFTKGRSDQLTTLANNKFNTKFVYFTPSELKSNK